MPKLSPTCWEEIERDDLYIMDKMIGMGFEPRFNYQDKMLKRTTLDNIPHDLVEYHKPGVILRKTYSKKDIPGSRYKSIENEWRIIHGGWDPIISSTVEEAIELLK